MIIQRSSLAARFGAYWALACMGLVCGPGDACRGQSALFVRGDGNGDGAIDLSDAVNTLDCLFLGSACPQCRDAADANDDGTLDLSDAVATLDWLFRGEAAPSAPSPDAAQYSTKSCGNDATPDALDCFAFAPCPQGPPPTVTVHVKTPLNVYALGEPVPGDIEVAADGAFSGRLEVAAFNLSGPEDEDGIAYHEMIDISLPAAGSFERLIEFSPARAGCHHLLVRVYLAGSSQPDAQAVAKFGVRAADFPQNVPDSILAAEVAMLDSQGLAADLSMAFSQGTPAVVQLGSVSLRLEVQPIQAYADGADVPPEFSEIKTYSGQILDGATAIPGSLAVLTLGKSSVHGMVRGIDGVGAGSLWIEPVSAYDAEASMDAHLLYTTADTAVPEDVVKHGHPDPVQAHDHGEGGMAALEDARGPDGAGGTQRTVNKIIQLIIFEHTVDAERTERRLSIVNTWSAIMRREFQGIVPRASTDFVVNVGAVDIRRWVHISPTGYGDDCEANLNLFAGQWGLSENHLHALFTDRGSGCGGIGQLGSASGCAQIGDVCNFFSITKDTHDLSYDVIVFGQETGHNLDWHPSWTPHPHDSHLDVSEEWQVTHGWWIFSYRDWHCTIMRASYDGCAEAEQVYMRNSDTGRRHLAQGILMYFPPF